MNGNVCSGSKSGNVSYLAGGYFLHRDTYLKCKTRNFPAAEGGEKLGYWTPQCHGAGGEHLA